MGISDIPSTELRSLSCIFLWEILSSPGEDFTGKWATSVVNVYGNKIWETFTIHSTKKNMLTTFYKNNIYSKMKGEIKSFTRNGFVDKEW